MNSSLIDTAILAAACPEAETLKRRALKWFVLSQAFMLLAGAPILLGIVGVVRTMFFGLGKSYTEDLVVPLAWMVIGSIVTLAIFFPCALFCIYKAARLKGQMKRLIVSKIREAPV